VAEERDPTPCRESLGVAGGPGTSAPSWRAWAVAILAAALLASPVPAVAAPDVPVPVSRYVASALAGHPTLGAMRQRVAVKENEATRARALDDPKVWVGVVSVPVDTWSFRQEDMTGKEIGVSQAIPYPGKRDHAERIVRQEAEQAAHELEETRNALRADVKMAYFELSTVRRQADAVRQARALLEQVVDVSREKFAVGKGSQPEVLKAQLEFQRMRETLLSLSNRERLLSIRLNTLSGVPASEPVPALDNLSEFAFPRTAEELKRLYLENRPARKAIQARIRRGALGIVHAEHEGSPDFEVSASYMQRDKTPDGAKRSDMFSAMLSVTLPIWRKGKVEPAIRAMTAEKEMAVLEEEALDLEAENAIGAALSSIASYGEAARLYRTTLLPQAEQSLESGFEAYRVGKIDLPMAIDSIVAVVALRREYAGMVGEMHTARARLETTTGRELE